MGGEREGEGRGGGLAPRSTGIDAPGEHNIVVDTGILQRLSVTIGLPAASLTACSTVFSEDS